MILSRVGQRPCPNSTSLNRNPPHATAWFRTVRISLKEPFFRLNVRPPAPLRASGGLAQILNRKDDHFRTRRRPDRSYELICMPAGLKDMSVCSGIMPFETCQVFIVDRRVGVQQFGHISKPFADHVAFHERRLIACQNSK